MREYKWIRHYIALYDEPQIKNDLNERTKIFNDLGNDGWRFFPLSSEPHHFCFCRETDVMQKKYEYL